MIDPATLLERLGIDVAKRSGDKLIAICPDPQHVDRTPSWAAWLDREGRFRHRCLSCGFGGGPVGLVMAVLSCEPSEAGAFLSSAERAGPGPPMTVQVVVRPAPGSHAPVPDEVWFAPLAEWPAPARRYLERRRFTDDDVTAWGMGYAVDGDLTGRIYIPVTDRFGARAAWTARSFSDAVPKYKSSTAAAPHVLLGEHLWSRRGGATTVVVVEGPFDAMAVQAAAPGYCVAALRGAVAGRAVDPGHAVSLQRFEDVVVATDPDRAGDHAAALLSGLARWSRVRRVRLPAGLDCAKLYEQGGADALMKVLSS